MRSIRLILPLSMILTQPLWGQVEFPKGEVFGGYAFSHTTVDTMGLNLNGWGTSVSGNFMKNFGLTADFSGVYGSESPHGACGAPAPFVCALRIEGVAAYHYLAGPRFTFPTRKLLPFAEALLGIKDQRVEKAGNWTTFAMGFGGGVDLRLGHRLAFRLFQADYVPAKRPFALGGWDSDFRIQTGFVIFTKLGKR